MKKSSKQSLLKIKQAITRLEKSEGMGRVARKNARLKLSGALRSLEAQVERDFPLEVKPKKPLGQTLEDLARRVKPETLDRQIVTHLAKQYPHRWDIDVLHEFINWISDACGRHCEPIVLVDSSPGNARHSHHSCNTWSRGLTNGVVLDIPRTGSDAWNTWFVIHKLTHVVQEHRRNGQRDLSHSKTFLRIQVELLRSLERAYQCGGVGGLNLPSAIKETLNEEELEEDTLAYRKVSSTSWKALPTARLVGLGGRSGS